MTRDLEGSEGLEPGGYLGEEFPTQGKAVERPPAGWCAWCVGVAVRTKGSGSSEGRDMKGLPTARGLTSHS